MGIRRSQGVHCFFEEIVLQDETRGGLKSEDLKSEDLTKIMKKCFGCNV